MKLGQALILDDRGGIVNRTDLQLLAVKRIEEARYLAAGSHFSGAYYLAGYAVELALKSCIAKFTKEHDFVDATFAKDSFSHEPLKLLKLANLRPQLEIDMKADPKLLTNWGVVCSWTEVSRYEEHSQSDAQSLIDAVTDPNHGVFQWIQIRW